MDDHDPPVLMAVSSSARQLYLLLRCIAFSPKAHVQIDEGGLRLSVDEAGVMEASVLLDKSMFTTYTFNAPSPSRGSQVADSDDDEDEELEPSTTAPTFQISLPALVETLQIFGLTDPATSKTSWQQNTSYGAPSTSFASSNIFGGMNNLCRITYSILGAPLSVVLTEASIRTQCDLTTYEPEYTGGILFNREDLALKVIMRGSRFHDAVQELSSTSPETLTMIAKTAKGKPFFALSSSGTLGSARVEFNNTPRQPSVYRTPAPTNRAAANADGNGTPADQPLENLLETFLFSDPGTVLRSKYNFSRIQKATRAMSVATKVSIRIDAQGVLCLSFMIEVEGGGSGVAASTAAAAAGEGSPKHSFVDFWFVPQLDEDEDGDDGEGGDIDETMMQSGGEGSDMGEDEDDDILS
ncbi:hypothetical protein EJ02DRAFT_123328 [Clathrospora elynae]|uniref:Rad1-domain-containing protein n=1 Tax=Clathrospora elynae TaxID=706981 RepID=A0A6A5S654_9PLEO|nr:hypothetical protein EJ02DRAFT_123328 [Clathrospora elynae]